MVKDSTIYFPERFVANRSYFKNLLKNFSNADFDRGDAYHQLRDFIRQPVEAWHQGACLSDDLLDERDEILAELHKDEFELPANPTQEDNKRFAEGQLKKMQTPAWQQWSDWLQRSKSTLIAHPRLEEETMISRKLLSFYKGGRNIFSINPFMVDLLKKTEVGNIRLRDIKLPYNSVYFHFEPIADIIFPLESLEHKHNIEYALQDLEKHYLLDGAFVTMENDHTLDITLTFIDLKDQFKEKVGITTDYRFPAVQYTLDFSMWQSESGFSHSLDTTFDKATVCFADIWDAEGDPGELTYGELRALTKQKEKCYQSEWEEYVLMDKALRLIVNCICYLNSVDQDIEIGATQRDADDILKQLSKIKKTQLVNKLKQKLSRFPYSKIHFCGNKLQEQFKLTNDTTEVDPHWRRGHWRNQPFGASLSQTKLIWIRPTIVRKDKGLPEVGHIYES